MNTSQFDNLPSVGHQEALKILDTPIDQLDLVSDYYKAAFHLIKYPGFETEQALLKLVQSESMEQAVVIARKKSVEVLARLGCTRAIPAIGRCLGSKDPYLVENAAWALAVLGCREEGVHKTMVALLGDSTQNRRTLIKSLSSLGVVDAVTTIKEFLEDKSVGCGIRGASLVAISKLCGQRSLLNQLEPHLSFPNQNERHCAVQDVIDGRAFELLPSLLKSPIAPSFRTKAVDWLWEDVEKYKNDRLLCNMMDSVIIDNPNNINLLHEYDSKPDLGFLIEEFFGTDYSRCYLALKTLLLASPEQIWPDLYKSIDRLERDYGALYFSINLFQSMKGWDKKASDKIIDLLLSAISSKWPQQMKFRPLAMLTLSCFSPEIALEKIPEWLNSEVTPVWTCRYAALMSIDHLRLFTNTDNPIIDPTLLEKDAHKIVQAKARLMRLK